MTTTTKPLRAVPEPSPLQASSRCMWKGSLSVGLLSVPVKLHAATGEQGTSLHQTHRADGARITMKKFCTLCDAELTAADVGKGYEMAGGAMVALTDDEAAAGQAEGHEIEVTEFCPAGQIDPVWLGKPYYLVPDTAGGKAYTLLAAALAKSGKAAITAITLRKAESMAVITAAGPYGDMLVLQLLTWAEDIRMAPALPAAEPVRPADLKAATALIASMTSDFAPARYTSASRAALAAVIETKIAAAVPAGGAPATKVPSLAATLRASLAQSKQEREGAQAS
jgi:DNA end-binding protein Ku